MTNVHLLNPLSTDFDQLVSSPDWRHRAEVARSTNREKYLDILAHDPAWQVRLAVAFSGEERYLTQLEVDENELVRQEVVRQRKFKEELKKW